MRESNCARRVVGEDRGGDQSRPENGPNPLLVDSYPTLDFASSSVRSGSKAFALRRFSKG